MSPYMVAVEQEADDFAQWMDGLTDAERASLALDYLNTLHTATGVVRSLDSRSPWLGQIGTVAFDGIACMEEWAREHRWPKVRAKLREERAEAEWEAMQARYA